MMISLFFVLKILLWLLIGIVALILLILLCPIFYKAEIRVDSLSLQDSEFVVKVSFLIFLIKLVITRSYDNETQYFRIVGIKFKLNGKNKAVTGNSFSEKVDLDERSGSDDYIKKQGTLKDNLKNEDVNEDEEINFFVRLFYKLYNKVRSLILKVKLLLEKKDRLIKLYETNSCKAAIEKTKRILPILMKHILPRKVSGELVMGFESADRTGMIFGYYSVFNSYFLYELSVIPDFENETFKGEMALKGRIIPICVLIYLARLWFNKDIRLTYKRLNKILRR